MIPADPAKVRFNEKLDHLQARRPFTYNLVTGALIGLVLLLVRRPPGGSSSPTPCRGPPSGGSCGGTAGSCAASTKRARCAWPPRRKPSAASAEPAPLLSTIARSCPRPSAARPRSSWSSALAACSGGDDGGDDGSDLGTTSSIAPPVAPDVPAPSPPAPGWS